MTRKFYRPISIKFLDLFTTYKDIQTSCNTRTLKELSHLSMALVNTLPMHSTVFPPRTSICWILHENNLWPRAKDLQGSGP